MSALSIAERRILNQPWEDVADDVTGAIEKAVQPLLKVATDSIYAGLLDATQDYLRDNLAFNIAERIDAAERQADYDRREASELRIANAALVAALETARDYVSDTASGGLILSSGEKWLAPEMHVEDLAAIDAALALARREGR